MSSTFDDRNRQLRQYQPMVRRMAFHLMARLPASVEVDDLIQVGMIGLSDAISRCTAEPDGLEKFAMPRVRGAMIDELRGTDWISRGCRRSQRQIELASQRLMNRLCRRPTDTELAGELGMPLAEFQSQLAKLYRAQIFHLEDIGLLGDDDDDEDAHGEQVLDWAADPLSKLENQRQRADMYEAMRSLPARERDVMLMRYHEDMTFKEIGTRMGVSESRVCQLHRQAVDLMRRGLTAQ
jgi:RNA polymerase sigma factor for flagellar operon FliA